MYNFGNNQIDKYPRQMKELADIARELKLEVEWVDKWSGGLMRINGRYFGYGLFPKYPLNSAVSRQLVKDKVYAYILMEEAGIKVPYGNYFFRDDENYKKQVEGKGIDEAFGYTQKIGYPVFVKPNRGALGRNCTKVENEEQLKDGLKKIFADDYIAIIQEVLEGREYRIMFLDGEIILCYEKSKPFIIENGKKIYSSDVANLSSGGVLIKEINEFDNNLKVFIKKIADLFGLRYGGIDIMGDDLQNINSLKVLEVNADPGLESFLELNREKGREVMRALLQASLK
jgi:glutathione synthase/RimK-type ligase-like ATP-grasp enzyme